MIKNFEKITSCKAKLKDIAKAISSYYDSYGKLVIISGYRSMEDQERIYKQLYGDNYKKYMPTNSAHLTGDAFDFYVEAEIHPIKIAHLCVLNYEKWGITGLGIPLGRWSFHVDIKKRIPYKLSIWYYNNEGKLIYP
ncbi:MAG: hypothetical protein GY756_09950 [bacterium]|nr:hypothetical protein [bacterium]